MARRLPAAKPGAGRGARYVSGKMPQSAKNMARKEQAIKPTAAKPASNALSQMNSAMTEEEKMNAIFAAESEQFAANAEELSQYVIQSRLGTNNGLQSRSKAPIARTGPKRAANVPDHEPPNGYVCYRCGEKGHWIQLCPTNDDPEFDNRPRVKRTTGIPRSFLKTVDKSAVLAQNGDDDAKRPSGIMVNAEGEFVVAEPDKATWEQFQAKAKSSAVAAKAIAMGDKEVEERGLACPIDKKLFIEPMKTPCCQKTYCNDCITNALIESDFVCPNCKTDGVLIDDLQADDEAAKKMDDYLKEKTEKKAPAPASPVAAASPKENSDKTETSEPTLATNAEDTGSKPESPAKEKSLTTETSAAPMDKSTPKSATTTPTTAAVEPAAPTDADANAKKRPADDILENPKIPKAPKAMQRQMEQQQQQQQQQQMMNGMNGMNGMFGMPMNPMMGFNGMNMGNFPMGMPNMGNMNMGMGMGMPMMNDMNPMMGGFNNMGGFPDMSNNGMFNGGFNNNMNGGMMNGMNGMNGMGGGMGMNNFNQQQQRHNFTQPNNEDDAYFRRPVNPHRHQQRQRRVRPSDYREL